MLKPLRTLSLALMAFSGACVAKTPPDDAQACTNIGCINGFHVALQSDAWPAGAYRVRVTADDKTVTCEGNLPLKACDQGNSLKCDGAGVLIGESGCALPAEQHSLSDLHLEGTPKQVRVSVEYNGIAIAQADFTPDYQVTRPNGPNCEPECTQASATLRVGLK